MSKFIFPNANPLKFVWLENSNYGLNQRDTLYYDFSQPFTRNVEAFALFQTSDLPFIQFRTDYQDFYIKLYNSAGSSIDVAFTQVYDFSTVDATDETKQYQIDIPCSALGEEYYYLKLTTRDPFKPVCNWQSEWFHVKTTHTNTRKAEWLGSENDEFIWGSAYNCLRFKSSLIIPESGSEKFVNETSEGNLDVLNVLPRKIKTWALDQIPEWLYDILELAISHEHFKLDGVEYSTAEKIEVTNLEKTFMVLCKVKLRQKDWGKVNNFTEITGDWPASDPLNLIISNGTDTLIIDNTTNELIIHY